MCESAVCVRIAYRIEYFQLQRILIIIKITNYKWSKRDVWNYNHISHYNPHTHWTNGVWSLIELASLSTVPLSVINGLSRLTKLTTSKGQAWPIWLENFRIGQSLSNRIEFDGRFEFESNLEASQAPNKSIPLTSPSKFTIRHKIGLHSSLCERGDTDQIAVMRKS